MIAGATLLRRRRDGRRRVPWLAGLVAIHPGWWMSAYRGDCGAALVSWSLVATTLVGLAAGLALCRSRAGGGASGGMRSLGDALIGTMAGVAVSAPILSGPVASTPSSARGSVGGTRRPTPRCLPGVRAPGTTATIRRSPRSKTTWSQESPLGSSAGVGVGDYGGGPARADILAPCRSAAQRPGQSGASSALRPGSKLPGIRWANSSARQPVQAVTRESLARSVPVSSQPTRGMDFPRSSAAMVIVRR